MTTDQTPQRWGLRQTAAAVGVAAVIAALGGAAIYAATDTNSHLAGTHQGPGGMPGGPPPAAGIGMHGSGGAPGAPDATALHGEFVVPDGAGGYTTMLSQTGTVTAVLPSSITVRSADGYTQAYAIPASVNPPLAVDDPVSIRATRTGDTATVTNISNEQGTSVRK